MDSHLDSHLDSQLLSLAEYSSKYHVSISTLRRKIRAGKLPFNFKQGKYFLKDQSLVSLKQSKSFASRKGGLSVSSTKKGISDSGLDVLGSQNISFMSKNRRQPETFNQKSIDVSGKKEISSVFRDEKIRKNQVSRDSESLVGVSSEISDKKSSFSKADLLKENVLLNKVVDSQKELLRQVELKEIKITDQQNRIMELNTLVALLERENKELKSLLHQEKEMEEWLELK